MFIPVHAIVHCRGVDLMESAVGTNRETMRGAKNVP